MNVQEVRAEFERVKTLYLKTGDVGLGVYLNTLAERLDNMACGADEA